MKIDRPTASETAQLLQLWKTAFGDHGGFWEMFLDTAFTPEHCRCITENVAVTAALYWFDCLCGGQTCAYVYAVVTHPRHRNRGLCRKLLEDTQNHLKEQGYSSVLLVPEQESLRQMYGKLGYRSCTTVSEFSCAAGAAPVSLRAIGPEEYAALRREMLPRGGVVQEGENLSFLAAQAQLFAGENLLLAAYMEEDTLHAMELLGDPEAAPGIVAAVGCKEGHFRGPGQDRPFAMVYPLTGDALVPDYFGFAFD